MNTLTLKTCPTIWPRSGNSLLSMVMQLSMSIGVTVAGMLLGLYGQQHISADAATTHQVFSMLPKHGGGYRAARADFAAVPDDTTVNTVIRRRKRSES